MILVPSSRAWSIVPKESAMQKLAAIDHMASIIRKQRAMNVSCYSRPFPISVVQRAGQKIVAPRFNSTSRPLSCLEEHLSGDPSNCTVTLTTTVLSPYLFFFFYHASTHIFYVIFPILSIFPQLFIKLHFYDQASQE